MEVSDELHKDARFFSEVYQPYVAKLTQAQLANDAVTIDAAIMENAQTRAFVCSDARGVYLPAVCVVFADDERTARDLLLAELWAEGLNENLPDTLTLREIPMEGAHVLWNGDY